MVDTIKTKHCFGRVQSRWRPRPRISDEFVVLRGQRNKDLAVLAARLSRGDDTLKPAASYQCKVRASPQAEGAATTPFQSEKLAFCPSGPFFWEEADAKPSTHVGYGVSSLEKIWRTEDLQILHNIASPVLICKLGHEDDTAWYSCCNGPASRRCCLEQFCSMKSLLCFRPGGARFFKETYFQNSACLNLLGKARPLEEYTALIAAMPDWERCNRRDWTNAITQVQDVPVTPLMCGTCSC